MLGQINVIFTFCFYSYNLVFRFDTRYGLHFAVYTTVHCLSQLMEQRVQHSTTITATKCKIVIWSWLKTIGEPRQFSSFGMQFLNFIFCRNERIFINLYVFALYIGCLTYLYAYTSLLLWIECNCKKALTIIAIITCWGQNCWLYGRMKICSNWQKKRRKLNRPDTQLL